MRKQGRKCPKKPRWYRNKINDIMAEETSEREFRMYIIKMIRKANEEMKEQMQSLKDCSN